MKMLSRNRRRFWYAKYEGENPTGDGGVYGQPMEAWANISAAKGNEQIRPFGANLEYDRVIAMGLSYPVAEDDVLWIDRDPYDADHERQAYDYVVRRVARSLNSVQIAVRRVNVS